MRMILGLFGMFLGGCEFGAPTKGQQSGLHEPVEALASLRSDSFTSGVEAFVKAKREWRLDRGCVSCHTNGWGLAAQPVIAPDSSEVHEGRIFAQEYLMKYLKGEARPKGQHGSLEGLVATSAFLALSDARLGQGVHQATREGLDHAWSLLDQTGTWEDWLQCNWPPFESDTVYGPTLMLVALGELAEQSLLSPSDEAGAERLITYLNAHPPDSLHDKAMRLWAGVYWARLLDIQEERGAWLLELASAQRADGGWSMASLAGPDWKRDDGKGQEEAAEAYPTAFASYVLLHVEEYERSQGGLRAIRMQVDRAVRWLRVNQQESGEWLTRSPRRDGKDYIGRAATAFALMVLAESGQKSRELH